MTEPTTHESIFQTVKKNIVEILFDVEEELILLEVSLTDLGANSLDRAEIALAAMEDLKLNFPVREMANIKNIGGLVDFLYEKKRIQ